MDIKTLVPDIYKELEDLSKGEPLPLTKDNINQTVEGITNAILSWATPSERNKNFTVRMSNIGKPARQLWFEKRDKSESVINAPTQIKFLYGHLLEEILLMLARMSGHKVTDEQKEVKVNGIMGHIDCKIDGEIVDIKTASKFAFKKFSEGTLPENDPFGYIGQLASYETAEKSNNGGFLAINKESGELCFYQPEDLDKPNMEDRIKTTLAAIDAEENMKIHKNCTWCKYKYECHSYSNDGAGLRTFKYSSGLAYFTKVVSEPRVQEIL